MNLKVRFTYGDQSEEVPCTFDEKEKTLYCKTPCFDESGNATHAYANLSITTDGINYSECEEKFKVYSKVSLQSIAPKCGSIKGGAELVV